MFKNILIVACLIWVCSSAYSKEDFKVVGEDMQGALEHKMSTPRKFKGAKRQLASKRVSPEEKDTLAPQEEKKRDLASEDESSTEVRYWKFDQQELESKD